MEGFNRILNKYLNLPHPNIFKFVDHLKTLDADMILKFTEFKSNPLDYSKYTKASKQVKDVKHRFHLIYTLSLSIYN